MFTRVDVVWCVKGWVYREWKLFVCLRVSKNLCGCGVYKGGCGVVFVRPVSVQCGWKLFIGHGGVLFSRADDVICCKGVHCPVVGLLWEEA